MFGTGIINAGVLFPHHAVEFAPITSESVAADSFVTSAIPRELGKRKNEQTFSSFSRGKNNSNKIARSARAITSFSWNTLNDLIRRKLVCTKLNRSLSLCLCVCFFIKKRKPDTEVAPFDLDCPRSK